MPDQFYLDLPKAPEEIVCYAMHMALPVTDDPHGATGKLSAGYR